MKRSWKWLYTLHGVAALYIVMEKHFPSLVLYTNECIIYICDEYLYRTLHSILKANQNMYKYNRRDGLSEFSMNLRGICVLMKFYF